MIVMKDPGVGEGAGVSTQVQKLGTEYALNITLGQTDELGVTVVDKP